MTLFRFVVLRWIWRLCLWWLLLWCTSRLELHLVPIHRDRADGLGYLEVVHRQFGLLILAVGVSVRYVRGGDFHRPADVGRSVSPTHRCSHPVRGGICWTALHF